MRPAQQRLRGLAAKPAVWALADQGAVSLGNFATNLVLARTLAATEYGLYGLVMGVIWYVNNAYFCLFLYPLSIRGSAAEPVRLGRITAETLVLGTALLIPLTTLTLGAAILAGRPGLGPPAAVALVCWQLQETLRRGLHSQLRHRAALAGDALSYLGQAVIVYGLAVNRSLSAEAAFFTIALTSALAALLQANQVGLAAPTAPDLKQSAIASWVLGRWTLFGFLVSGSASVALPWTLAIFAGPATVAEYQAASYLVTATNPIIFSTANLLLPSVAQVHQRRGIEAAIRTGFRVAAPAGLLLVAYLGAIAIWPDAGLRLLYGPDSPYATLSTPVRLLAVMWLFNYVSVMLALILEALRETRSSFAATAFGGIGMLALGVPLSMSLGVVGAILSQLIVSLTKTALAGALLLRVRRGEGRTIST